jgi:hypothetical protein
MVFWVNWLAVSGSYAVDEGDDGGDEVVIPGR